MKVETLICNYKKQQINCLKVKNGDKLLICFHGFANNASELLRLTQHLSDDFTIIIFDLPGHGNTVWNLPFFESEDVVGLVRWAQDNTGIFHNISLLGFSLGGRLCLKYAEYLPENIDHLILIAPDGIKENFWYRFATRNSLGKLLFQCTLKYPQKATALFSGFKKLGLVQPSLYKFASKQLANPTTRSQLAVVWPLSSKLKINIQKVVKNLNFYKVPTIVFTGKFDQILNEKDVVHFCAQLNNAKHIVLESGHNLLIEKHTKVIADEINQYIDNGEAQ